MGGCQRDNVGSVRDINSASQERRRGTLVFQKIMWLELAHLQIKTPFRLITLRLKHNSIHLPNAAATSSNFIILAYSIEDK